MRARIELPPDPGWARVRMLTVELEELGYTVAERRFPGTGAVWLELG